VFEISQRSPDSLRLGQLLQGRRSSLGLSRAEFSHRVGVSLPYIGMLERGDRAPGRDLAQRILEALGYQAAPTIGGVVPQTLVAEDPETGEQLHLRFTVSAAERARKFVSTIAEYEAYASERARERRPSSMSWTRPSDRYEEEDLESVGPLGDSDLAEIVRQVARMNPNELRLLARWVDLWTREPDRALALIAELPPGPAEPAILLQEEPPFSGG
jgi:transcriptional regulator with XRE-family HTH domain